ncbi:MAG: hypothetical protein CMF96_04175 [Candidatus Marinimicrobia bacterium]|nr:hypothetical protein [Candidatus Neomarinimicrobiota bacterium]
MIQAILGYLLIFITIFLTSISISFTVLKSGIENPRGSKFRVLQQKKLVKSLLKNYNIISITQDSLQREIIFKKIQLESEIITLDSLLNEMDLNKNRLMKNENLLNKNLKILAKALK